VVFAFVFVNEIFVAVVAVVAFPNTGPENPDADVTRPLNVDPAAEIPFVKLCVPVNVCAVLVTAIFVTAPVVPFTEDTPVTIPVSPLNV
jgi:hypothetical protein